MKFHIISYSEKLIKNSQRKHKTCKKISGVALTQFSLTQHCSKIIFRTTFMLNFYFICFAIDELSVFIFIVFDVSA